MDSFLVNHRHMSPEYVERLRIDLARERAEIQTIICGVDRHGAHLFRVEDDGRAYCNTAIGFTAIGDGEWHASSQFMFAKYTPTWTIARALLLLHTAKKHAEVAPGVGEESDMFFMPPNDGVMPLNDAIRKALADEFHHVRRAQNHALEESNTLIEKYIDQLAQPDRPESSGQATGEAGVADGSGPLKLPE